MLLANYLGHEIAPSMSMVIILMDQWVVASLSLLITQWLSDLGNSAPILCEFVTLRVGRLKKLPFSNFKYTAAALSRFRPIFA